MTSAILALLVAGNVAHSTQAWDARMFMDAPAVNHYPSGSPYVFSGVTNGRSGGATYCTDPTGACTAAGAYVVAPAGNTRVETDGVLIEKAGTNHALNSEDLTLGAMGGAVVTANVAGCPCGATTMDRVQGAGVWGYVTFPWQPPRPTTSAVLVWSGWMRSVSGNNGTGSLSMDNSSNPPRTIGSCSCGTAAGNPCSIDTNYGGLGTINATYTGLTEAPTRGWLKCSVTMNGSFYGSGGMGLGATDAVYGGMQLEVDKMTSYIATAGTVLSRGADTSYVANSWLRHTTSKWCVKETVKPYGGAAWAVVDRAMWSVGTNGALNSAKQVADTSGNLVLTIRNGSNEASTHTAAHGMAAVPILPVGNGKQIAGANVIETLSQYVDGSALAGAQVNGGARTWDATPATMYFGSLSAAGSECDCYLKNVSIYEGACP